MFGEKQFIAVDKMSSYQSNDQINDQLNVQLNKVELQVLTVIIKIRIRLWTRWRSAYPNWQKSYSLRRVGAKKDGYWQVVHDENN